MTSHLTKAAQAHQSVLKAQATARDEVTKRDEAVALAHHYGSSAIQICEALNLSRQQIHKILDRVETPEARALKDEVAEAAHGIGYHEIMPEHRDNLDCAVQSEASKRGISLT